MSHLYPSFDEYTKHTLVGLASGWEDTAVKQHDYANKSHCRTSLVLCYGYGFWLYNL